MLNLSPQHPAVHGVLRLIVETHAEVISQVDCEISYLHRGTKKLCEYNEYYKIIPYFDRFDYVSLIHCEHSLLLAIESLMISSKIKFNLLTSCVKSLYNKLIRISSHLLALTTSAMNISAITPFLFAFEEREEIATILKSITSARLHTALYKIGGINFSITENDLYKIKKFILRFKSIVKDTYELLTSSAI